MAINDTLELVSRHQDLYEGLFSPQTEFYMYLIMVGCLLGVMSVFGCVANTMNIIVFLKQGLNDNMTIGFLCLAVTDFFQCFISIFNVILFHGDYMFPNSRIDFHMVMFVRVSCIRYIFTSLSTWTMVLISVEKCLCVIWPFKFRHFFTRRKLILILAFLYAVNLGLIIPVWATQTLGWVRNEFDNLTYYTVVYLDGHDEIFKVYDLVDGVIFPVVSQCIVTVSAILMVSGLRKASKFRQSSLSATDAPKESKTGMGITGKDRVLAKTVILLVIIMSTYNVPFLLIITLKITVPGVDVTGEYYDLIALATAVIFLLNAVNASLNIFVYYNVSQKYREIFLETFWPGKLKSRHTEGKNLSQT